MKIYTEIFSFKTTKKQKETLIKLKNYKINTSNFVREAIKEKLQKEYLEIIKKNKKEYCPF